jgi:hypothetical protein
VPGVAITVADLINDQTYATIHFDNTPRTRQGVRDLNRWRPVRAFTTARVMPAPRGGIDVEQQTEEERLRLQRAYTR